MKHKAYAPAELAVRLHHRLALIHPSANGNGRCTRLLADVVMHRLKAKTLNLGFGLTCRSRGLRAPHMSPPLHEADNHNLDLLIAFAQS
jgi:fido (protein-threonine AMPylation protein)